MLPGFPRTGRVAVRVPEKTPTTAYVDVNPVSIFMSIPDPEIPGAALH